MQLDEELAARIGSVDELVSALEQAASSAPHKDDAGALERGAGYDALVRDASVDELPEWMRAPRGALSALAFGLVLSLSRLVGRLFLRVRVEGLEQLPREAPFLICPNHQSYADAFLVTPWLPRALAQESFALGFAAYFEGPIGRRLARFSRTIPTDADHNVRASLRVGAAGLTQGRVLVLFPEGARSMDGSLLELKPGAAVLASRLGLPIVPVAIEGAFEAWPRSRVLPRPGRVRVRFGAPLLPESEGCPQDEGRWLRRLERAYAELGVVGARRLEIDGKSAQAGTSNAALPHRDSS